MRAEKLRGLIGDLLARSPGKSLNRTQQERSTVGYWRERTRDEVLTGRILALCMVELSHQCGQVGDRLKAMKILFKPTYELFERRIKALDMCFYRWEYGPYSVDAVQTWETLDEAGLLILPTSPTGELEVTDKGRILASEFTRDMLGREVNAEIAEVMTGVAEEYAAIPTEDVMDRVYELRVSTIEHPKKRDLKMVPRRETFTHVLEPPDADGRIEVEPEWLETLAVEFSPKSRASLERAISDLSEGHVELLARQEG